MTHGAESESQVINRKLVIETDRAVKALDRSHLQTRQYNDSKTEVLMRLGRLFPNNVPTLRHVSKQALAELATKQKKQSERLSQHKTTTYQFLINSEVQNH